MMTLYKNKYRNESFRRPDWDYSGNGYYYITMVIQKRKCLFVKIENNKMIFSVIGNIAKDEWYKSFKLRTELILDECIFMPNHIHAIVIINKTGDLAESDGLDVGTHGRASLQSNPSQSNFHRKPKSLSSFIAGYKSSVTTLIDDCIDSYNLPIDKFNRNNRLWQRNYHDRVIRNENEYLRIKNYIIDNPKNWLDDEFRNI